MSLHYLKHHYIKVALAAGVVALPLLFWDSLPFLHDKSDTRVTIGKNAVYEVEETAPSSGDKDVQLVLDNIDVDMRDFNLLYQEAFFRDLLLNDATKIEAPVVLENTEQSTPFYEWEDGIRKSFFNFINKDVYAGRQKIGQVEDILVQRNHPELDGLAGTALYLVYKKDNEAVNAISPFGVAPFELIVTEQGADNFHILIDSDVAANQQFNYAALENHPDLISLKQLQKGSAINAQGQRVGQVYAVTYDDKLAREIIIVLDNDVFNLSSEEHFFAVPFTEVDFRLNDDSVALRLTDEQLRILLNEADAGEQ